MCVDAAGEKGRGKMKAVSQREEKRGFQLGRGRGLGWLGRKPKRKTKQP